MATEGFKFDDLHCDQAQSNMSQLDFSQGNLSTMDHDPRLQRLLSELAEVSNKLPAADSNNANVGFQHPHQILQTVLQTWNRSQPLIASAATTPQPAVIDGAEDATSMIKVTLIFE